MKRNSLAILLIVLVVVLLHIVMAVIVVSSQADRALQEAKEAFLYFYEPEGDVEVGRFAKATVVLEPQVR